MKERLSGERAIAVLTRNAHQRKFMTKPSSEFVSKRIPLYYQLENLLRERIMSGAFGVGSRLPTENELIRQYGVSRITVRQALSALAEEGLIERRQGKGTFATERRPKRRGFEGHIDLTASLDEILAAGAESAFSVIEMNRVEADMREADLLAIEPGEMVYRIKRINLRGARAFGLTVNYLPAEIGERVSAEELRFGSLLRLIETKFGVKLKGAKQQIGAALADPYLARLLDVRVGSPLLSIERTSFSDDDRPVEFAHALYGADLYSYVINLTRTEDAARKPEGKKRK
jgi:GntR family transcriptional regulator